MWFKLLTVGLVVQILMCTVTSRSVEMTNSEEEEKIHTTESVEIYTKTGPRRSSAGGFVIFGKADDPFFNFVNGMVNMSYLSSQIALNRMKQHSDRVKEIGGHLGGFIEKLPTFPIPVLDDMSHDHILK